ncbi:hypothetical protein [Peribacillus frigoritolerans]|uniref:Stage II sporulation protein M n=1 Tax=Peribacillus castrilensis TaxID=2897690 RepID=A0AAW9N3V0_9BACI|nr:hypothetical protein [Peribacillus castrilensis]
MDKDDTNVVPYGNENTFFFNVLIIFSNNFIAIFSYLIPVIGAGKFLLDIFITVSSIKVFLLNHSTSELFFLFLPHFFIEFYVMSIWLYLSWALFNVFFKKSSEKNYKSYFYLIFLSIVLLFLGALIEVSEGSFFFD